MKLLKIESESMMIDEVIMFVPDDYDKKLVKREVRNETNIQLPNITEVIQLPEDVYRPAFREYRCYVG